MQKRITKRIVDTTKPGDRRLFVWDTDVKGFGLKVMPSGQKSYVLQYRLPGLGRKATAKRLTLGRHGELTPDQARKLAAQHLLALRSGSEPAAVRNRGEAPTIAALAERFLHDHLPAKKKPPRPSTITYYDTIFRWHILPELGTKRVADVTSEDVERLHTSMKASPYMANRTLSVLRQAFDQADRWGWLPQGTNPAKWIDHYQEARRGAKKEVMLTSAQMSSLLEAIDEAEEAGTSPIACSAIRFAFWTGWRIGEVLRLEWANLDFEKGSARLVNTKTAAEEYRQLPTEALDILRIVPKVAGCPYVFPGQDLKGHLTTVRTPWRHIRKHAGLENLDGLGPLRLHDLRHNVVSWDVSRGVPLEIAGRNVGHRSRRSTEVYAHFAPDALKQAADERAKAMRAAIEEEST